MHAIIVDTSLTTAPTGGAQTFLVDLCRCFVNKDWRITVVTQPGPETAIVHALQDAGVKVLNQVWRSTHLPEERGRALAQFVNTERPDAYVISISPDAAWLALPLLDQSIPTISIAHNDVLAFYAPVKHYAPLIDCAVGVSAETTRRLREETGLPFERVREIPYGIHPLSAEELEACFAFDHGPVLRIGYVGRLVQDQKRIMEFVGVARKLRELGVEFELNLVGDGIERMRLESEFNHNGLGNKVNFWGWLTPDEVKTKLLQFDVFTLLSDFEGLPVALLEAMGHGVVPVVTRIPSGNMQLIRQGENGLLFEVGDLSACANHLAGLAKDPALIKRLGYAAWETAREYSVERMAQSYEECFRELTANNFSRAHRLNAPDPYPLLPACRSRYPTWLRKVKSRLNGLRSSLMPLTN